MAKKKSAALETVKDVSPEAAERFTSMIDGYYAALVEARETGKPVEDLIDNAGMEALRTIVGMAEGASAEVPTGAGIVPSVEERGEHGVTRGDIFSILLKKRIILLEGEVNDAMASIACASLHYLASEMSGDPQGEIKVYINSPGGSVLAGLAIYDTMRSIKAPIQTVGIGMQASMGSILLASGDTRLMTKNSHLMIHQIASGAQGKASDLQVSMALSHKLHEQLKSIYVRHIGLTRAFWDKALERDTWLTANQALKMGYIHGIVQDAPSKKTAYEEESIRDVFTAAAEAKVPKTLAEIKETLNDASAGIGENATIRPELVTALAQYPEYWTTAKMREYAAANSIKLTEGMTREEILEKLNSTKGKKNPAANDNAAKTSAPAMRRTGNDGPSF